MFLLVDVHVFDLITVQAAAVAARSEASAAKFAKSHGVEKVHESYEALVNDPGTTFNNQWSLWLFSFGRPII